MAIAGKDGSVKIGANAVTKVSNWNLDIARDMLDDTSLGDDWRTFCAGLAGATGSIETFWNVNADTTGQTLLQDANLNGTTVAVDLYPNATNYYSSTVYVSNLNIGDPVDDLVTATFDCQVTGAVTYT